MAGSRNGVELTQLSAQEKLDEEFELDSMARIIDSLKKKGSGTDTHIDITAMQRIEEMLSEEKEEGVLKKESLKIEESSSSKAQEKQEEEKTKVGRLSP